MKKILGIMFISVNLLLFVQLPAQQSEQSIEDLYLNNFALTVANEFAASTERESKFIALTYLEEMVDSGEINSGSVEAIHLLGSLGVEGTGNINYMAGHVINDYPMVRKESCRLLGVVGGAESEKKLKDIIAVEPQSMVVAEAVYALGVIGNNENNDTTQVIYSAYRRFNLSENERPDNLIVAILNAVEKIADKNGGISDPGIIEMLMEIRFNTSLISIVRQKAEQIIEDLRV